MRSPIWSVLLTIMIGLSVGLAVSTIGSDVALTQGNTPVFEVALVQVEAPAGQAVVGLVVDPRAEDPSALEVVIDFDPAALTFDSCTAIDGLASCVEDASGTIRLAATTATAWAETITIAEVSFVTIGVLDSTELTLAVDSAYLADRTPIDGLAARASLTVEAFGCDLGAAKSSNLDLPQEHCDALVALYNTAGGENWSNNTGWSAIVDGGQTDPCSWQGTTCFNNRLTRLGVDGLSGSIPPELGALIDLQFLSLKGDALVGPIPAELGALVNLRDLVLTDSGLTGTIPAELGDLVELRSLILDDNQISGLIPSELGALANLEVLQIENNQLSGPIPAAIGDLSELGILWLYNNSLSGQVPASLANAGLARSDSLQLQGNSCLSADAATVAWMETNFDPEFARDALGQGCPPAVCDGQTVTIDMNVIGGPGVGTPGPDVILGTPGDDVIEAGDGDDIVCAGDGNDAVAGGAGDDRIFGEDGRDILRGNEGEDHVDGGEGNDRVLGGVDDDRLIGGDGDDYLGGFGGADTINGGPGNETIFGGFGADTIDGGAGADTISGLIGDDVIDGGSGNDTLNGDRGNDTISGGSGNDVINGGNANDILNGQGGDDTVNGGGADDQLAGGGGTDTCVGNKEINGDTADASCELIFGVP